MTFFGKALFGKTGFRTPTDINSTSALHQSPLNQPPLDQSSLNQATDRLHGLDAVRGFALLLGVILHASMSYLPGSQYFWLASDTDQSTGASLTFFLIHNFRMITFFLLAGFFAHMAFHRLGLNAFAKDRWKRIGKPLLIGWPFLFSAIVAVLAWGAMLKNGGTLPTETPPGPAFTPSDFPLTHLWFLYVLVLFYIVVVALRSAMATLDKQGRYRTLIDTAVRALMRRWAPIVLALPVAISLYVQPQWYMWFGIPTPDHTLYMNVPAAVGFGLAFTLGWLLHRQTGLIRVLENHWLLNLLLAIVTTVASLSIVGIPPALVPAEQNSTTLGYALCYSIAAWSWTFALIGMALRFLSGFSATRRYLSDASYWIYLIHLPLVAAMQTVASRVAWPWFVELPLSLVIVFTLMLLSYQWFVRYSFIGATLNGRKMRRVKHHSHAHNAAPSAIEPETP